MRHLDAAGIYTIIGLSGTVVNNSLGYRPTSWDTSLYRRFTTVIDEFQKYPNVLGFVVAFSVEKRFATSLPFVKAAVRDLKNYILDKKYRTIPVGYAGHDDDSSRISDLLNCGEKMSSIDFYGVSRYRAYCDRTSLEKFEDDYRDLSIPAFWFQSACVGPGPHSNDTRLSTPISYGILSTEVFSGAITLPWFNDDVDEGKSAFYDNNGNVDQFPGLVDIKFGTVVPRPAYSAYSTDLANLRPISSAIEAYSPKNTATAQCHDIMVNNSVTLGKWLNQPQKVAANVPPTPYERLCSCMMESLSCIARPNLLPENQSAMNMTLCNQNSDWCRAVSANGTTGLYGTFSVCNSTEQASWVLDQNYRNHDNDGKACSSAGGIPRQKTHSQTKQCRILLQEAGPAGTGTITTTPGPDKDSLEDQDKAGMSTAVKITIAVLVVFALTVSVFLLMFIRYRKRHKKMNQIKSDELTKPELPDNQISALENSKHELDGAQKIELPTIDPSREELAVDDSERMELPGSENEVVELETPNIITELPAESPKSQGYNRAV
jgi:hypothetical protein